MRKRILIWALAVLTATIVSLIVGVVGYAMNLSPFPPEGGGVFKLIVLPICVVWIFILSVVYFSERRRMRRETQEAGSKIPEE
jgi:uncharacterized BrkB/YihY/UPF0761 family membrane protein